MRQVWDTGQKAGKMGHGIGDTGQKAGKMGHRARNTGHRVRNTRQEVGDTGCGWEDGTQGWGYRTRIWGHGQKAGNTGHRAGDMQQSGHRTGDIGHKDGTWDTGLGTQGTLPGSGLQQSCGAEEGTVLGTQGMDGGTHRGRAGCGASPGAASRLPPHSQLRESFR